jgi:hypothetical protein
MHYPPPDRPRRRRLWPVFVPFLLVVVLAVGWTGLWFYAAGRAETALTGWRAREARAGRIHNCGSEAIGGFPFRIEVRCRQPSVELRGASKPVTIRAADLVVAVQIYQPTLLIAEFSGPMTVEEQGSSQTYSANWSLGQASVRGTPQNPQRGSLAFDRLVVTRQGDSGAPVFTAERFELHGRMAEGSKNDNPVIEAAVRARGARAPEVHALTATPIDADINALLRGLADLSPKPWSARLREIQARGGNLEIVKARLQQGESIAVTTGSLGLTAKGLLDGQLQMTAIGIEHVLKSLDLESVLSQGRVGARIDRLDRIVPGLGAAARKNAAPGILAGLGAFGQSATLDGKPAVSVPLRFAEGRAMLGPFTVGRVPPLF